MTDTSEGIGYLEGFCLQAQPLGAKLHDGVRTERVSDPKLTDSQQPQSGVHLQLGRGNQDGLMP